MKNKSTLLERVNVSQPCDEDWDAMQGNDTVRFCSHCAKSVHNLSAMTRAEAETLIRKSNKGLCVRYVRRADASIATLPTSSSSERLHDSTTTSTRASRLAATAFTAALAVSSPLAAQTSPAIQTPNVEASVNQPDAPQIGTGSATIAGTVYDMNDAVVPGAKITLTDGKGAVRTVATSDEGVYRIENLPGGSYKLEMDAPGFALYRDESVSLTANQSERYDVTLETGEVTELMGVNDYCFPSPKPYFP